MQRTTCNIGYAKCDMQLATLLFIYRNYIAVVCTPTKFVFFYFLLAIAYHFSTENRPFFPLIKINDINL